MNRAHMKKWSDNNMGHCPASLLNWWSWPLISAVKKRPVGLQFSSYLIVEKKLNEQDHLLSMSFRPYQHLWMDPSLKNMQEQVILRGIHWTDLVLLRNERFSRSSNVSFLFCPHSSESFQSSMLSCYTFYMFFCFGNTYTCVGEFEEYMSKPSNSDFCS